MKKYIVVAFAISILSTQAFSQTTIKPAIGINFTDFSTDANGEAKGKPGYQIGGSIAFGKKFYFEPGLFYVGKSTKFTSSNSTTIQDFDAKIKGVRIPVTIGLNFLGSEKSSIALRVFGGVSAFFITSTNEINKDMMNTTSWGTYLGAGIDFWKLFVDLSYEWSLTNIQEDVSQIDLGKTRSLFVNAGIRINL